MAGLFLWFAPGTLHNWLTLLSGELREMPTVALQATHVDKTNRELAAGSLAVAIIFLLSHG